MKQDRGFSRCGHRQRSNVEQSPGTGLAADVDAVVRVGEAVELGGRALGVSAHLLEVQPVTNVQDGVEAGALANTVDTVAGWAPDGVLDSLAHWDRVGLGSVVQGLSVGAENLGHRVLVVKHDAREVAVHSVVDVGHIALAVEGRVLDSAASDDVASDGEGRGDVETTRLGDDVDIAASREELCESSVKDGGHVLERLADKASADIEGAHVESMLASLLEDSVRIPHSLVEGHRVRGPRSDVEADTHNIEAQVLGQSQKSVGGVHGGAELHAEAAQARGVVGHDTEEELGAGVQLGDLVELIGVVEGHLLDPDRLDVADVRVGLAGLGIDDTLGLGADGQDLLDLRLGGAVEAGAELGKEPDDLGVRVALDSWAMSVKFRLGVQQRRRRTVEGLDAGQVLLPAEVLAVDLAEVCHEEGVLVAGVTHLVVDGDDALVESVADQLLGVHGAMLRNRRAHQVGLLQ